MMPAVRCMAMTNTTTDIHRRVDELDWELLESQLDR
jgi:hypothetical protein